MCSGGTKTTRKGWAVALVVATIASLPCSAVLVDGFTDSLALRGLQNPTAVRFAVDGRVFVAEKRGVVMVFDDLSDPEPDVFADLRTEVHNFWDRGLLGLELHPDFPAVPYVYVLYTRDADVGGVAPKWGIPGADSDGCPTPPGPTTNGCTVSGRLARLQASGNFALGPVTPLVDDWCQQFPGHSVGALGFDADGALLVSAGEGASFTHPDYGQSGIPLNPCGDPPAGVGGSQSPPTAEGGSLRSQDLRTPGDPLSFHGSLLRVDPLTGTALPDNPLAGGNPDDDRIVAFGLRNPYRFTVRPGTSQVWIGDVGADRYDEIDVVDLAADDVRNFGWPCYEGEGRQERFDGLNLNLCENLYTEGPTAVAAPFFAYDHERRIIPGEDCLLGTAAISGMSFYSPGSYPESFDGGLFFTDYNRRCIWFMPSNDGEPDIAARSTFGWRLGRCTASDAGCSRDEDCDDGDECVGGAVDLQTGPDNDLFYVNFDLGEVRRIRHTGPFPPPVADIQVDNSYGPVPLTVRFDASGSSDPEPDDVLSFAWDLDGDGEYDDSNDVAPTVVYSDPAVINVRLRVTDMHGKESFDWVRIDAGNTPPWISLHLPDESLTWSVGDTVLFSATAGDDEDGALPAEAFLWSLSIEHCGPFCHTHFIESFEGVASGAFVTPDHEYPTELTLRVRVHDSWGRRTVASVVLHPKTTLLRLRSEPPGLQIEVGNRSDFTPFDHTVIVGSQLEVSTAAVQGVGGAPFGFENWSDGGALSHLVLVPPEGMTLTASFVSFCGNGFVDVTEECDLGAANCTGLAGCTSGCTADCKVVGRCTQSGDACAAADDCASEDDEGSTDEGCCGDGSVDAPAEACDDGNELDGDCCSASCQLEDSGACEPQQCPAMGPHLRTATIDRLVLRDRDRDGRLERWRSRGALHTEKALRIDAEHDDLELTLGQAGAILRRERLPSGSLAVNRPDCRRRWRYLNRSGSPPDAPGWKTAILVQQRDQNGSCSAAIRYLLASTTNADAPAPAAGPLRQTLRIGDDCYTALTECAEDDRGVACAVAE